jgi:type IV secretory pathway VirB2 component (pilin)
MKKISGASAQALIAVALTVAAQTALAAGGGLDKVTSETTSFKTWFYGFLGVVAVIVLLYYGLMAWFERKSWADFGMAAVGVAVVGSVGTLTPYLWTLFTS